MPSITDAAFESFVNVHKFYARGDGTTDDTAAIQDCIDNSEGPIYFPPGSYKLSGPLTIQGQRSYLGAGGNGVSALVQTSASDPILTWPASTAIEYATVEGLTFQANVSGGAKGIVAPSGGSAVKLDVRRCWFWRELLECINTPMIYGNIEHNFFGGYGATSYAQHQHIQCLGNGGSNFNYVAHNRFYNATGNESCVFDWGFHLVLLHNNWEQNGATTTLRLKGLTTVDLSSNWFEDNDGVYQVISEVGSGGSTGNKIITSHNNWWNPNGTSNQYLFKTAFSAGRVYFGYEAGTNFGSIEIVDDNDWYAFSKPATAG